VNNATLIESNATISGMILIYSSKMMGFGFWGSKGGNEFGVAPTRSGNHVEHELAFFNKEWPTTSL